MIIWIASYPRSGNTFLRIILNSVFNQKTYSIYNDEHDIGADSKTSAIVGHEFLPDSFDLEEARASKELYLIKTHDHPQNDSDKAIYLVRDGRESCLSYQKYTAKFAATPLKLVDILYGNVVFGSWGEHIDAWRPAERNNTLLIRFEELIDKPRQFLDAIGEFICVEPQKGTIPTFNRLQKINPEFFRSGEKSSWKSQLSESEHIAFWLKNAAQMIDLDYLNDMPADFRADSNAKLSSALSSEYSYRLKKLVDSGTLKKQLEEQRNITLDQVRFNVAKLEQSLSQKIEALGTGVSGQLSDLTEKAIKESRAEIGQLRNRLHEKEQALQEAQRQKSTLENELASSISSLESQKSAIREKDEQIKSQKALQDEQIKSLTALQGEHLKTIANREAALESLQGLLSSKEALLAKTLAESSRLQRKVAELENRDQRHVSEIETLSNQLSDHMRLRDKLEIQDKDIERLGTRNSDLQDQLKGIEAEFREVARLDAALRELYNIRTAWAPARKIRAYKEASKVYGQLSHILRKYE